MMHRFFSMTLFLCFFISTIAIDDLVLFEEKRSSQEAAESSKRMVLVCQDHTRLYEQVWLQELALSAVAVSVKEKLFKGVVIFNKKIYDYLAVRKRGLGLLIHVIKDVCKHPEAKKFLFSISQQKSLR